MKQKMKERGVHTERGEMRMYAECIKCRLSWNVSIFRKIPETGYICPRCRKAEERRQEY